MNGNFIPPKPKKGYHPANSDSFIEALRSLGSSGGKAASQTFKDFSSEAFNQISGTQRNQPEPPSYPGFPPASSNFPKFPGFPGSEKPWGPDRESKYKRQAFFERQKATVEKVVFTKTDQQTKLQIQSLQEEIKKLAASTQNLAKEISTSAFQAPVNPGTYHLSFFEKLRQTIRDIRKRIDSSASWLSAANSKGKKKQNFYWSQVSKSGTKYSLSQERYMQTSAG